MAWLLLNHVEADCARGIVDSLYRVPVEVLHSSSTSLAKEG